MRIISDFRDFMIQFPRMTRIGKRFIYGKPLKRVLASGFRNVTLLVISTLACFSFVEYHTKEQFVPNGGASVWIRSSCLNYQACEEWFRANRNAATFARSSYGPLREVRDFFEWKVENAYPATPIWFAQKDKSILNPRIMDIWPQFRSIMPPTDAYRELVTWHSKVARPEPKIPEIPNDTKIALAGFDMKTSFRKPKS